MKSWLRIWVGAVLCVWFSSELVDAAILTTSDMEIDVAGWTKNDNTSQRTNNPKVSRIVTK